MAGKLPTLSEVERALKDELETWMRLPYGELPGSVAEEIFARVVQGQRKCSMKLFDVTRGQTGWSLKTKIVPGLRVGKHFAVVLALLHPKVIDLSADKAGAGLIEAWQFFFASCLEQQEIRDPRQCIILTSPDRTNCVFFQEKFKILEHLTWEWTSEERKGIQGRDAEGRLVYRWFPRNGQLMGEYDIPATASIISIDSPDRPSLF